jgi:DNA-binding response OmpR family regulator
MKTEPHLYYSLTLAPIITALIPLLPQNFQCSALTADKTPTAQDLILITDQEKITSKAEVITITPPIRLGSLLDHLLQKAFLLQKPLILTHGLFTLDRTTKSLCHTDGAEVKLTDKELDLFLFLYGHFPNALSKDDILKHVWHYAADVTTHTVETHIYRLRQKCDMLFKTALIETTDEGYKLYDPPAP